MEKTKDKKEEEEKPHSCAEQLWPHLDFLLCPQSPAEREAGLTLQTW